MRGQRLAIQLKCTIATLRSLIGQCVARDEGWKAFYAEKMNAIPSNGGHTNNTIDIFKAELDAEVLFQHGDPQSAVKTIQTLIDKHIKDEADVGWYLQEMARLSLPISRAQSEKLQLEAHKKNRYLLKPATGMVVSIASVPGASLADSLYPRL